MDTTDLFYRFGVAVALGIMIGMEREFVQEQTKARDAAGVRTFGLLGAGGCAAALIADTMNIPVVFAVIFGVYGALIVTSYVITTSKKHVGMTTEIGAIMTLLLGAMCYLGYLLTSIALAVVVTSLLSLKIELHTFARNIRREDLFATLKFAVITAIVLPLLPNHNYGPPPLDVFNPYSIWLMVIFISAISFSGYVLIKVLGPRLGIGLTGLLGGLVSSTAVTLGFTQRSQEEVGLTPSFAMGIIISWTTMYVRIGVILAALNLQLFKTMWPALLVLTLVGIAYAIFLYMARYHGEQEALQLSNPFSLKPALKFGLLYVVILFVSKVSQVYLGDTGVYISSLTAGLVDLSAITLSLARLSALGQSLSLSVAGQSIVLAAMANTVVKGSIVLSTGSASLRKVMAPGFVLLLIASIAVVFFMI